MRSAAEPPGPRRPLAAAVAVLVALPALAGCAAGPAAPAREPAPPAEAAAAASQDAGPPAATAAEGGRGAARAVLVFAASQAGEIVPCGCSPDQRGGLPREGALLATLRKADPGLLFIDAGDALFASPRRPEGPSAAQALLKARALAEGDALLGASARALGGRDLAAGVAFAVESAAGVPLLDAGGAPSSGTRAALLLSAGEAGVKVGVFAAGLGEDPARTIAARAAALRAQGARVVVLLLHPRGDRAVSAAEALLPAARQAGVDLVVLGRRDDPATDAARVEAGSPPLFALEGHGQSLLRLELSIPPGATPGQVFLEGGGADRAAEIKELDERIALLRERAARAPEPMRALLAAKVAELEQRRKASAAAPAARAPPDAIAAKAAFLPLDKSAGEDPRLARLVADYDAQVSALNLAAARKLPEACPAPAPGERAFLGVSRRRDGVGCASCHAAAAELWLGTGHARAYATLVEKKKQFSLDCIQCHVTGWQQPGGVCRIDRTAQGGAGLALPSGGRAGEGRQDVQCEMCHGAGSEHVRNPPAHISRQVPEAVCKRCHEAENSPHFQDALYRPWIVGPGHGEPLAQGQRPRPRGEIDAAGRAAPPGGPAQVPKPNP